jgi:hypothetical protein
VTAIRFPLVRKIGTRDGRAIWQLEERWELPAEALTPWLGNDPLVIPAGMITDFASVPRIALSIIGDVAHEAALGHDWLYQAHGMFQDRDEFPLERIAADVAFYEWMGMFGPTDWRRKAMFSAVRLGGGHAWAAHEQRMVALNPYLNTESQYA